MNVELQRWLVVLFPLINLNLKNIKSLDPELFLFFTTQLTIIIEYLYVWSPEPSKKYSAEELSVAYPDFKPGSGS